MEEYKHDQQNDAILLPSLPIGRLTGLVPSSDLAVLAASSTSSASGHKNESKKKKAKAKKPSLASLRASLLPPPRRQCSECDRSYSDRRDLRRHVLTQHQGVRYMCRLCGKVMMSSKSVRAHLKSSHGLSDPDEIGLNVEKVQTSGESSAADGHSGAQFHTQNSEIAGMAHMSSSMAVGKKKS